MSEGGTVETGTTTTVTDAGIAPGGAGAHGTAAGLAPAPAATTTADHAATISQSKTLATGDADRGDGDNIRQVKPDWPDDWRDKVAGEDKKFRKQLDRYNSPSDYFKKARELEAKFSAGERGAKAEPLPENATAEELAAWRKDNGIPETADKYDTNLGDGFAWAETDKPLLQDFTTWAHERNWSPDKVKEGLAWYAALQNKQSQANEIADEQFHATAEDQLRKEWGNEYRRNINYVASMFESVEPEFRDSLLTARLPNGRLVGDDPRFNKWISGLGRELNPAATLVPGGGTDPIKGIEGRLSELNTMMGDRHSDYWKGPKSAAIQAEYRDLIEASQKLKSRAAA